MSRTRPARFGATGDRRSRFLLVVAGDAAFWLVAVPVATALRFDLEGGRVPWVAALAFALVGAELHVVASLVVADRWGRSPYGTFEDVARTGSAVAATAAVALLLNGTLLERMVPLSVPVAAGLLAGAGMATARLVHRLDRSSARRPTGGEPVLVFGAGDGGSQLVTAMLHDPGSPFRPVGLLDDDPAKADLRVRGVPVLGTRRHVAGVAARTGASRLLIAIPSAPADLIRDLSRRAAEAGLGVLVLPPVGELLGSPAIGDLRRVTESDLLGRHAVDTDLASIAHYLTGRRVLVTGAGGSIGAELCRQIHRFAPERLVVLDRDESALHAVQLSLSGRALLDSPDLIVADIRDRQRVDEVFEAVRPEVVFHAAALKHLPLLEQHPAEAVKTNVWGTLNVLRASAAVDVGRFVNVSTDKAADPVSVLGHTKRIAERLTAAVAADADGTYLSVRFGNVLASRGSVLGAFDAQIHAGGPVTVTHPEVTRYFMTVEEAVQLVVQAGAIGASGEVLVLDMGEPVRIADVAARLIEASGREVEIVYTGLRAGEKLHEVLFASDEAGSPRSHPLIAHVAAPPLEPKLVEGCDAAALVGRLRELALDPAGRDLAAERAP